MFDQSKIKIRMLADHLMAIDGDSVETEAGAGCVDPCVCCLPTVADHRPEIDFQGEETMNFLEKLMKTGKTDKFGIDAKVDGIRQLRSRLDAETQKLKSLKDGLRDAALENPEAQIDEMPVIRQREKIAIFESALEQAKQSAATELNAKSQEIKQAIATLEDEQRVLRRQRDLESLMAVKQFCVDTGAQLTQPPRKGVGGIIRVVATSEMDESEVNEFFEGLKPKPVETETTKKLNQLIADLHKLQMVARLGSLKGLESLAG
jgi:hypothetical protein